MGWLLPNLPAAIIPLVIGGVLVAYVAYEAAASAWAAHSSSKAAFTPIFDAIAEALDQTSYGTGTPGIVTLDYAIEDARRNARAAVSREAAAQSGVLAKFYAGLDTALRGTVDGIADAIATTGDVIGYHGRVAIPGAYKKAGAAGAAAGAAGLAAKQAQKAIDRFRKAQDKNNAQQGARIRDAQDKASKALPRANDALDRASKALPRAKAAQKDAHKALVRTRAAALAGTVITYLVVRWGWRFLRCSNAKRLGRALRCNNFDPDLWDGLLLGTLAVFGSWSIVDAVKDLQKIENEAITVMSTIIREL